MANYKGISSREFGELNMGESYIDVALQQLVSGVTRNAVNDFFTQARQEDIDNKRSLLKAAEINVQSTLTLDDPSKIQEEITSLKGNLNKIDPSELLVYESYINSLENHHGKVIDAQTEKYGETRVGGFTGTMQEVLQKDEQFASYVPYLEGVLGDLGNAKNDLASFYTPKDKEGNFLIDVNNQDFINKFGTLSQYLRKEKNDFVNSDALDKLDSYIGMVETRISYANAQNEYDKSLFDFAQELDDIKKNPDQFGELSIQVLSDTREDLWEKSQFIDNNVIQKDLDKMEEEANNFQTAFTILNSIDAIESDVERIVPFSRESSVLLEESKSYIDQGIRDDNLKLIKEGIKQYNKFTSANLRDVSEYERGLKAEAKSKEVAFRKSKSDLENSLEGKIETIAETLRDYGRDSKGKNITFPLASDYDNVDFDVANKFSKFSLDSKSNMIEYKNAVFNELNKFVSTSNLDPFDDREKNKIKKLLRDIENIKNKNLSTADKVSKADELYKMLSNASVELDFEGYSWGSDKDKNAQDAYQQFLKLYGRLYDADIEAMQKFGPDYGYDRILKAGKEYGIDDKSGITGESTEWLK